MMRAYTRITGSSPAEWVGLVAIPRRATMQGISPTQAHGIAVTHLSDPGAVVEAIVHQLLKGGATDLKVTAHPLWIIGQGASGCRFQVLWEQRQETYYVSRWTADAETVEVLGHFPDWDVAVNHALHA